MLPLPPRSTLFPYTTLFRSDGEFSHVVTAGLKACPTFSNSGDPCKSLRRTCPVSTTCPDRVVRPSLQDRKSTRLNSSHSSISYAVFCLKKKTKKYQTKYYVR